MWPKWDFSLMKVPWTATYIFYSNTIGASGLGAFNFFSVWTLEKNHKTSLSGGISTRKSIFLIINFKKSLNNFLSPYAICIIKFSFRPILRQKILLDFSDFRPNFLASELAKMKILLCKWHMAIKSYLKFFFDLLLKNLTSKSKCFHKGRFCDLSPRSKRWGGRK